jgi:hypothetical protein
MAMSWQSHSTISKIACPLEKAMNSLSTGSDTVIGAALMQLRIKLHLNVISGDRTLRGVGILEKLQKRFSKLFDGAKRETVVIVMDYQGAHYVVKDARQVMRVWQHYGVGHAFTMPKEAFERIRGDVVISPVPKK